MHVLQRTAGVAETGRHDSRDDPLRVTHTRRRRGPGRLPAGEAECQRAVEPQEGRDDAAVCPGFFPSNCLVLFSVHVCDIMSH